MDGLEDKQIWLSIVIPTASGSGYWQRHKNEWMSLHQQWPHFELNIISSSTKFESSQPWLRFVFSGKTSPMARRFLGFSISDGPFTLFLDDDCKVEARTLDRLVDKMRMVGSKTLVAGRYISPDSLGSGGKAFNELCNQWLKSGPHFLGGAFCLPNSDFMEGLSFGDIGEVGGEEDRMAQELFARGGAIAFLDLLQVQHLSEKSFLQFVERAYRHGRNWQPDLTESVSLPRRFLGASVREWPWLVSHGFGLMAGAAIGRIEKLVR